MSQAKSKHLTDAQQEERRSRRASRRAAAAALVAEIRRYHATAGERIAAKRLARAGAVTESASDDVRHAWRQPAQRTKELPAPIVPDLGTSATPEGRIITGNRADRRRRRAWRAV